MKANAVCTGPIRLECDALEEVEVFIYLASVVNIQGGTDADVKACISKARTAFLQLKNIWISRELSPNQDQTFEQQCQVCPLVWI